MRAEYKTIGPEGVFITLRPYLISRAMCPSCHQSIANLRVGWAGRNAHLFHVLCGTGPSAQDDKYRQQGLAGIQSKFHHREFSRLLDQVWSACGRNKIRFGGHRSFFLWQIWKTSRTKSSLRTCLHILGRLPVNKPRKTCESTLNSFRLD